VRQVERQQSCARQTIKVNFPITITVPELNRQIRQVLKVGKVRQVRQVRQERQVRQVR
jgi:hypothetical protein